MGRHSFIVGTFNTNHLYTLELNVAPDGKAGLEIVARSDAKGSHSWLAISPNKRNLYATCWTEPPAVAAYAILSDNKLQLLNTLPTAARSGYVCCSDNAVYSAGGPTGEVYSIDPSTGALATEVQKLDFVDGQASSNTGGGVLDFGGLRHGAHSADLSPDKKSLYIADIGRNCVWTYSVGADGKLKLGSKHISPRPDDGPRHTWPHPSGRYLYSLQEHTSIVDVFEVAQDGVTLKHVQGVKIIPQDKHKKDYWADEVRLSEGSSPKYLYASTRGLGKGTAGYVAVFALDGNGLIKGDALDIWATPTSGGWANAVEPGPTYEGKQFLALTDSEEGLVMVLTWDGEHVQEVARVKLDPGAGAATAVWLS